MMKNLLKEISLGFRTIRYGFQLKTNIALVVIFFILGIITEIGCRGTVYFGGFYMTICGIVPMQLICSLGVSDLAKSSPKREHMETFIPTACSTVTMLAVYTVLMIIKAVLCQIYPEYAGTISYQLIMTGVMCALIMVYCGVVFKHFILSIILLCVAMSVGGFCEGILMAVDTLEGNGFIITSGTPMELPFIPCALAGYLLILIGGFLCWLLTKLFYKHEMSKYAYGAALRKAMR